MVSLSIVVPAYNEEENIGYLHSEIKYVCEQNNYTYEIIIVDDGSSDKTAEIVSNLYPIKLIRFRKNFGQTAAIDAGIKHAQYEYVVTMDGDCQNDPRDIPHLVQALQAQDVDVVSGWRKHRKDTFAKNFVSRGAHFLRTYLINDGIRDSGCTLKIYKRNCFDHFSLYGEMHRFIPALLKIKGYKLGEIDVKHHPRTSGKSSYNWRRTVKGFIDMISVWFWNKYAVRPLHFLGGGGLVFFFLGGIFGLRTIYLFFLGKNLSATMEPLLTVFFLLGGIFMFTFGLITDILSKLYYERTNDTPYTIKEIIEHGNARNEVAHDN